jgi:hypothetical protein
MSVPETTSEAEAVPLSRQLLGIFDGSRPGDLTLNELLLATSSRGPYAVIVLLCIPFLTPISLPGISNVFGAVIMILAWQIAREHPARLPSQFGDRSLSPKLMSGILRASSRLLMWIERLVRPRRFRWLGTGFARWTNASMIALGGLLLALPLPPTIPLSNFVPGVATLLLAASVMEKDGVMVWWGYLATVAATVYLTVMVVLNLTILIALWHRWSDPVFHGLVHFWQFLFS